MKTSIHEQAMSNHSPKISISNTIANTEENLLLSELASITIIAIPEKKKTTAIDSAIQPLEGHQEYPQQYTRNILVNENVAYFTCDIFVAKYRIDVITIIDRV